MSKDRIKEINYLIYLRSELIKQARKEIKELQLERKQIEGYKNIEKKNRGVKWFLKRKKKMDITGKKFNK